MAADVTGAIVDSGAEPSLRRADIGHGGTVGGAEHRADLGFERRHRRGDDGQLRVFDCLDHAPADNVERAPLGRERKRLWICVVPRYTLDAGAFCRQPD